MFENIALAFQGIWNHKLRSMLTMLGIIIGIASIITIVSTIKGTNEQIKQNLIGSGVNAVVVSLYQDEYPLMMDYTANPEGVSVITERTRRELLRLDGVESASLFRSRTGVQNVYYNDTAFNGSLFGVDKHYFEVYDYDVNYGRNLLDEDFDGNRKVVLVDDTVASSLFGGENPVGRVLEINAQPFTVVGVVSRHSTFTPVIETIDDYYLYANTTGGSIFIPETTWPIVARYDEPQSVAVGVANTDDMTTAGKAVADYLTVHQIEGGVPYNSASSEMHNGALADGMDDMAANEAPEMEGDFSDTAADSGDTAVARSPYTYRSQDMLETAQNLQAMSNATNNQLIWIASISLLVGGIGVMNIMLVSVTERTSEIGLKKAIGAKRRRILAQFLTEAAVLTSLGGILGVAGGIVMAKLLSSAMQTPTAISIPAILVAVLFSVVIGVIFGLLPATKAARMNPIDALRRE